MTVYVVVTDGFAITSGPEEVFNPVDGYHENNVELAERLVGLADKTVALACKLVDEPWQNDVPPENVTSGVP